jgi:hypothetical protein
MLVQLGAEFNGTIWEWPTPPLNPQRELFAGNASWDFKGSAAPIEAAWRLTERNSYLRVV